MKVLHPERIARARRRAGFTQANLAALVGCTQQYISAVESGADSDCSEAFALRVVGRLNLDLEDVFESREITPMSSIPSSKRGTNGRRSRKAVA